jgi:hypothetical protein
MRLKQHAYVPVVTVVSTGPDTRFGTAGITAQYEIRRMYLVLHRDRLRHHHEHPDGGRTEGYRCGASWPLPAPVRLPPDRPVPALTGTAGITTQAAIWRMLQPMSSFMIEPGWAVYRPPRKGHDAEHRGFSGGAWGFKSPLGHARPRTERLANTPTYR